jgi:hypothetical protein
MLMPIFEYVEALHLGNTLDDSGYLVAFVNIAHLLALTVFLGAVAVVDVRLLGRGFSQQPLSRVARDAQPWLIAGFLAVVVTGILQVLGTPMKAYHSVQFWFKMQLLFVAVIFTFVVRHRLTQADENRVGPLWGKLAAVISIALWTTIAVEGRLIGLLQ